MNRTRAPADRRARGPRAAGLPPAGALALALGGVLAPVAPAQPASSPATSDTPQPALSMVMLADQQDRAALRDLDGDGRLDLLLIGPDGVRAHRLRPDGTYPEQPDVSSPWPETSGIGWNLADIDGDGRTEVLLLLDGRRLVALVPGEDGRFAVDTRLEEPDGFLPRGIRRVNFLRDVDGDGRLDVVVPGAGRFLIHLRRDGGWAPALAVEYRASVSIEVGDPDKLDKRFGEDLTIPWFSLRDVDGDGTVDLVSQTDDAVAVHLARPDLQRTPSWTLDLAALREELPKRDGLDLDNLLGNIEPRIHWNTADLDGRPPWDLVLQQGGSFRVCLGGSTGPHLDAPDQVLKASGNVLHFLLRDVDGDGRNDLQILRAQGLSLADALRLLVVPGSFEFDVFTYSGVARGPGGPTGPGPGEGVFDRRPAARTTVALRIPALLGFLDDVEELKDRYETRLAVPAQAADLSGAGRANDVVDLREGELRIWRDAAPAGFQNDPYSRLAGFDVDTLLEEYVIRDLDRMGDGGRKEIGLEEIEKLMVTPGWDLRQAVGQRPPDATIPVAVDDPAARLRVVDLDGDGREDVVVTGKDAGGLRRMLFLVGP